jgi:GNAT superfamily N-acetyltransferase
VRPEDVARACRDWVWISEESSVQGTAEWMLVRNPDRFAQPLELVSLDPSADPARVVAEVVEEARRTGLSALNFWLRQDTPEDYVALLRDRGAVPDETLAVLARDLRTEPLPGARPRSEPELGWVRDAATARHCEEVDLAVFGGLPADEARLARTGAQEGESHAAGRGGRLVAYLGGRPVGAAGLSLAAGPTGPVARLWGGAVLEPHRRRGVYSALLRARLEYATVHGAAMALVKGRVETSAPILRRAGFREYGTERSFRVPLR